MKTEQQIDYIYTQLGKYWPKYANKKPAAKIHKQAYTSLIGVMLSAQSQDKRTAIACKQLFALADNPEDMIKLSQEQIIEAIRPAGLHNAKSKNILATSYKLLMEYDGKVPQTQKELMDLPGVGRKSSDIMMRFVWGAPNIAVDTHVYRLSRRLNLSLGETPDAVEKDLMQIVPEQYKKSAHHLLILHGRYTCKARNPECETCVISKECIHFLNVNYGKIKNFL